MWQGAAMGGAMGGSNLLTSMVSSAMQYGAQKKAQKRSAEIARNAALNQYVWARMSLERAGFNPILAVSQPPGMPHAGTPGFPGVSAADVAGGFERGMQLEPTVRSKKARAEIEKIGIETAGYERDKSRHSARREEFLARLADYQGTATLASAFKDDYLGRIYRMQLERDLPSARTIGEFDATRAGKMRTLIERWFDAGPNINLFGGVTGPLPSWKKKGGSSK